MMFVSKNLVFTFAIQLTAFTLGDIGAEVSAEPQLDYEVSFDFMKEAYYEEDWDNCVNHGLASLTQHGSHMQSILGCRKKCKDLIQKQYVDSLLSSYAYSIHEISCIERCKPNDVGPYHHNFVTREPYDFIQICYYKLEDYNRGAAAATTFLAANPNHSYMKNNVRNYKEILNVTEEHCVDMEAGEYESLYKRGLDAYENEQWSEQIVYMAASLDSYHDNYNNCSLMCEEGYNVMSENDRNHEVVGGIADQMEKAIRCKHQCRVKLSKIDLKLYDDIVANIYHHLQYAYSKAGYYQKGAEYAAAFMLHLPDDKDMIQNKNFMVREKATPEEWFIPTQRAVIYKQNLDELDTLMTYLDIEYISQHAAGKAKAERWRELEALVGGDIKVNSSGEDLGGKERVVADGFATQSQCTKLINLCKEFGSSGDGYEDSSHLSKFEKFQGLDVQTTIQKQGISGHMYEGNASPFTEHEIIYGIGVNESLEMTQAGSVDPALLELYMQLSERTREFTEIYFNTHRLYFDYTHLVCRTAIDEGLRRDDLSHPIHSDNCNMNDDGTCDRIAPAYTHREYSALLYLNDDFEGGEFFFADKHLHEQTSVRPTCGRVVAFNSGEYHGVKAVRSGRRCAVAVWFTLDPSQAEQSRQAAYKWIDDVKLGGQSDRGVLGGLKVNKDEL